MSVVNILGYPVSLASAQACAREMDAWIDAGEGCRIVSCINPHSYASAKKLPEFAAALRAADWLLPDGIGVVIAGKLTGIDGLQRATSSRRCAPGSTHAVDARCSSSARPKRPWAASRLG
jgi:N-acetylglucosaminyldiphosphoundecaprenol N-acetyl-beta-D-mannosaminyltransferase